MTALLAAALAGFAALSLEILGVRWLAPWFGTTSLVWTNQIGVVLAAMAAGAALGGRLARSGRPPLPTAAVLLGGAGLLLALALALLGPFCAWLLPPDLRLEEAAGIAVGGSLAGALLFFAPPVLLLAMVAPLLVEARSAARGAGRAAGEVSAAGTAGSLLGVFGSTYLALPVLGIRPTLALVAAALVLAGALLASAGRRCRRAAPALLPLLPLLAPDPAANANLPALPGLESEVREVRETPYQRLRVVEFRDPAAPGPVERWLQMNEGLDSYQSRWLPDSPWPGGYYDLFALAPCYALDGAAADRPVRFWSIGHACGAALGPVAAVLGGRDWRAVGVELDPAAVELGRKWLPATAAAAARTEVVIGDGRVALRGAPPDLDFLLVDAYAAQFEIPGHLATLEFFREARAHLRPGGVLALNLGTAARRAGRGRTVRGILGGLVEAFPAGGVRLHEVPFARNVVVFARRERPLAPLDALAATLPGGLPRELAGAVLPGQVREGPALDPGRPFLDDRSDLALALAREWLGGDS
ncbi:MAG: hypothetical protein D6702_05050 [Planctomycetota bacterium]|nr:MAG: hypothetical protein D6702_05050 [Planctomycetota bacterium]